MDTTQPTGATGAPTTGTIITDFIITGTHIIMVIIHHATITATTDTMTTTTKVSVTILPV